MITLVNAVAGTLAPHLATLLWGLAKDTFSQMVLAAEELYGDGNGGLKKQAVLESINERIDIPLLSEESEATLLRHLVGPVIDLIVEKAKAEGILKPKEDADNATSG